MHACLVQAVLFQKFTAVNTFIGFWLGVFSDMKKLPKKKNLIQKLIQSVGQNIQLILINSWFQQENLLKKKKQNHTVWKNLFQSQKQKDKRTKTEMQVSADIVSTFKIKSVSYSIKSIIAPNPVTRKGAENSLISFLSGHLASRCRNRNIWPSFREEWNVPESHLRIGLKGQDSVCCAYSCQSLVQVCLRFCLSSSTASVALCCSCCCIALLRWMGQDGRWVGMGGSIGRGQDGGWWLEGCWGDEGSTCYRSSLLRSAGGVPDGRVGTWEEEEEECGTTCCCWTWHTEPASAEGALWWPAAFSARAAQRKRKLNQAAVGRSCVWTLSDLLRSPAVAQRPQLVWMCDAHLVQRGQVPGQVRSKVLRDFGQVGDILRARA